MWTSCSMTLQERCCFQDFTPQFTIICSVPGRSQTQVLLFQVVLYCTRSPVLRQRWGPACGPHLNLNGRCGRRIADAWPWSSGWQEAERNGCELPGWWRGLWRELAECVECTTDRTHQVACRASPSHSFTLPSLIRSHHFLSPATLISDNSAVSVLTSILKQPVPSLPLLSTLNLTTVTLSTTIFLNLKLTASSRFRTILHVLWLMLLNLLLSQPSSDLCTGSRSTNASNINSFHLPTKFSQLANLTIYIILSLCSVLR